MTSRLTVFAHANRKTLLEATELAPVAIETDDQTRLRSKTLVVDLTFDAAAEEALKPMTSAQTKVLASDNNFLLDFFVFFYLTAFATDYAVVKTRGTVATNFARVLNGTVGLRLVRTCCRRHV